MPKDQETTPPVEADDKSRAPQDARTDQAHEDGVRRQRQHIKEMTGQDPLSSIDD